MDYISLAIEAKKKKDFNLAIKYYQKQIVKKGVTIKVLQSAAKTYYLNKQKDLALQFYLASAHLYLHLEFKKFEKGDEYVRDLLDAVPKDKANQFPHMIGDLLYYTAALPKHVGHTYLDDKEVFKQEPDFKDYAEIYYAQILGDGSVQSKFESIRITPKEFEDIELNRYIPMGYQVLRNQIYWDKIDEVEVLRLYIV